MTNPSRALLLILALVLAFAGGVFSHRLGWFSSPVSEERASAQPVPAVENTDELAGRWREARDAGQLEPHGEVDAREVALLQGLGYLAGYEQAPAQSSVTTNDRSRACPGVNFATSGHAAEVELLDMDGRTLHRWTCPPEGIWPEYFAQPGEDTSDKRFFRRALLTADGDVIGMFAGLGLVRINQRSELLWAIRGGFHHHLTIDGQGQIWILDREKKILPRINKTLPILEDYLVVLSPGGEVVRRLSLLECFERSNYRGVLDFIPQAADIFHTNTVQLLDGSSEAQSPFFRRGNVLISLRHTNTIAVVDPEAERVVWALSGNWRRQHEPILLESGRILLLDNLSNEQQSRVVEFDPFTQEIAWEYAGTPDAPFLTRTCGTVQRLLNGNTLITESDYGRAFEVTPAKEIVWEYYNPHRAGEREELIATLFELLRLPADFPFAALLAGAAASVDANSAFENR